MIANVQHWTELIAKKLSGTIRVDEAKILFAWVARDPEHREYYDYLTQVWNVTGTIQTDVELPEADWDALERRIQTPSAKVMKKVTMPKVTVPQVSIPGISWRRVASIAAAVLVLVVGASVIFNSRNKPQMVLAEAGNKNAYEVMLPDGSSVILRKGSALSYYKDFKVRDVSLDGEGFFSVTPDADRPFSVQAGTGTIRVLGTKFNVKALGDTPVELFVEEGRVAFAPTSSKYDAKIFSKGQAGMLTSIEDAEVERTAAPGQNITSWISGKLVFDHSTLDHVLTDLSRHFSIPIEVADPALYPCELKADFDHATLDDVLETLRFSLNLQIDKSGERYIVSGEPCPTDIEN